MKVTFSKYGMTLSFLIVIINGIALNAQQSFLYSEKADSVFLNLNKSLITTDILYDRAFPLSRFDLYNPVTDTVDYEFAMQTYHELYQANYRRGRMTTPSVLNNMVEWENLRARVPIMILDYLYNKMDTLAIQDGLFTHQNGMLYDVANRSRSPYFTQHLQIAAPLMEEVKSNTIMFVLMPHFISRNTGLNVQQVVLNFGNGNQTMNGPLDSLTINFTETGIKNFTIAVTLSNGTSFTTKCRLAIGGNNIVTRPTGDVFDECRSEFLISDYSFQGYDEPQAFYGQFQVNYYYRKTEPIPCDGSVHQIKKPVIIIDGYDPTDKRTAAKLYKDFLYYYDDINFPSAPLKVDIVNEMREMGYDVIIVNIRTYFHTYGQNPQIIPLDSNANDPPAGYTYAMGKIIRGGGDYVERNALTLVTLINRINDQLDAQNSTEKLVVIGPSMGGQISRYALKWMEDRNMDHNVRLWVSFDSNHKGSLFPIGTQSLVKLTAGLINSSEIALERQINSPHAKQSLVDHHLFHANGTLQAGGAPNFHIRYFNSIDSLGWPQQCRKISLISGAENGQTLPVAQAGEMALLLKLSMKRGGLLMAVICGVCTAFNFPILDAKLIVAPPPSTQGKVLELKIPLLFNLSTSIYNIGGTLTRNQSIETVQGGFYWGYKELTDVTPNGPLLSGFWGRLIKPHLQITMPFGYHAHQPTGNTLAYGKGPNGNLYNFKWDDDVTPYNLSLPCDGYIPFDYYFGPSTFSLKHDSLFYQQARVLIEEIQGTLHYNVKIKQASITSTKTIICNGETATLTLDPPASGVSYIWTTPNPSIQIISGQGTPSIVIQNNGAPSMNYTINCQSPGPCYTFNANYTIRAGVYGSSDYPITGPSQSWCGYSMYFSAPDLPGATNYDWFWPSNWYYLNGQGTRFLTLQTPSYGSYLSGVVGVRVHNICGTGGSPAMKYVQITCSGGWRFTVSPNPATDNIVISTSQNQKQAIAENNQIRIYQLRIMDQLGNIIKRFSYTGGIINTNIPTSGLAAGVYIIQAYNGESWESTKFVKQ